MAKHVYPPFTVGVADSSSVHLTLDVNRVITAFTLFAGSGGDFGVSAIPARSDHTHITSYDGRYVLRGGDTITGNYSFSGTMSHGSLTVTSGGANITGAVAVTGAATISTTLGVTGTTTSAAINASGNITVQKADPTLSLKANSGNPILLAYDTTNGGVALYSVAGRPAIGKVSSAGAITSDFLTINQSTGLISFLGDLIIDKASANVTLKGTDAGLPYITIYDTTDGGYQIVSDEGSIYFQAINGSIGFIGNPFIMTQSGVLTLASLAGSGNRVVQANNSGVLSVPSQPTISDLTNINHTHLSTSQGGILSGGSASMVLLYTGSSGSVASFSLPNNTFSSTYSHYLIKMSGITLSTSVQGLFWRGRTSGTDDSGANAYKSSGAFISVAGTQSTFGTTATIAYLLPAATAATITDVSFSLWVHDPADASYYTQALAQFYGIWSGSDWYAGWSGSMYNASKKTHDSITFIPGSGNFSFGKIEVWGFRKV